MDILQEAIILLVCLPEPWQMGSRAGPRRVVSSSQSTNQNLSGFVSGEMDEHMCVCQWGVGGSMCGCIAERKGSVAMNYRIHSCKKCPSLYIIMSTRLEPVSGLKRRAARSTDLSAPRAILSAHCHISFFLLLIFFFLATICWVLTMSRYSATCFISYFSCNPCYIC